MSDEPQIVWEASYRREKVRLFVSNYHGQTVVQIRAMYQKPEGDWAYGKNGCCLPIEELGALSEALASYLADSETDVVRRVYMRK
jgi:hypothetical protein